MPSLPRSTEPVQAIKIADIKGMLCAWDGCRASMRLGFGLETGWVSVIVADREVLDLFKVNLATDPAIKHDIVFCAQHAAEFERSLQPFVRKG